MDISFLAEYLVPVVVGLCFGTGWLIKKHIKDVDNRWIPTICAIEGIAISMWINWGSITPEVILGGMISGLAAVGVHQEFKTVMNKKGGK